MGDPEDATSSATVFGKLNHIKENSGSGGTIDLIYTQTQALNTKLLEVQTELGFNGKSTTAYDEMIAIKGYVDTVEASLSTLDTRTSSIASSVTSVSNDLKAVTDKIGKVSVDSFTQLFEVKKTDIDYLKNKVIELKAVADINRQLLEKAVNQPIVKVVMEWGSVIIKFVIVNPSDSTTQKIPFKAFLPKEVKQEYIIDLGGLSLNYDATTEQYYVTADITLPAGESVIRSVEIKDVWFISDDEIASLRKQADELSSGLKNTSYFAQGLTLKTDINTRLDKVARKQKDNNATPQDHILAFRENVEDMKAVQENIKGLKDLVLNSGAGSNFLASIGGIQTFATWGIVLVLIFGMGALGMFYYQLWRKKVVAVAVGKKKKTKEIELPTPMPFVLPGFNLAWLKKILFGWLVFIKIIYGIITDFVRKILPPGQKAAVRVFFVSRKTLILVLLIGAVGLIFAGAAAVKRNTTTDSPSNNKGTTDQAPSPTPAPLSSKEEKVKSLVAEMVKEAVEKKKTQERIDELLKKTDTEEAGPPASSGANKSASPSPAPTSVLEKVLGAVSDNQQLLVIKQTPTDWLNVRQKPSITAEVITRVYPGESYPFSEVQSGWYKILLKDLTEGWVSSRYVEQEKDISAKAGDDYIEIAPPPGSGVNIRQGPDKESKVIKTVYISNKYPKLGEENGWVKIELVDGVRGWVLKDLTGVVN